MATIQTRISETSKANLDRLTSQTGQSQVEVIDKALDLYRRELFFQKMNEGYEALKADSDAWQGAEAERAEWDETLSDGL